MYINSRHLRIVKVVKNIENISLEEMALIFNKSTQHIRISLKEIYTFINNEDKDTSIQDIIKAIKNSNKIRYLLRKNQHLTKYEKLNFLLFVILIRKKIKLNELAKELQVTKRILNYYLVEIKEMISKYHLEIKSTNQGISLIGSKSSKNEIIFIYIFKFLIERNELPYSIRKLVFDYISTGDYKQIKKESLEICEILSPVYSDKIIFFLFSYYIAFKDSEFSKNIKNIQNSEIYKYRPINIPNDIYENFFLKLRKSSFGRIPSTYLYGLIELIKKNGFICSDYKKEVINKSLEIKSILIKYIGKHLEQEYSYLKVVSYWINYCFYKSEFKIEDLTFLDLRKSFSNNSNILNMTQEIAKIVPTFTYYEGIILYYRFSITKINKNENNIFIYKNIPNEILELLKYNLEKIHNVKIKDLIHVNRLEKYIINNKVDCVIIVENIEIKINGIQVLKFFIPQI